MRFENGTHENLLLKHPVSSSLKIIILFSMGVVAVQYFHTSSLKIKHHTLFNTMVGAVKEERSSEYSLLPIEELILVTVNFTCSIVFLSYHFIANLDC